MHSSTMTKSWNDQQHTCFYELKSDGDNGDKTVYDEKMKKKWFSKKDSSASIANDQYDQMTKCKV